MALLLPTQRIGVYAFLVGIAIAIITGIASGLVTEYVSTITLILVSLGLIVGYLNISNKEMPMFIVASIGLIVAGSANLTSINTLIPNLGTVLQAILTNIVVFIAPAVIVVGLKAVYVLAKAPEAT